MAATIVTLDSIFDSMRSCFRAALASGRNWHAVTVGIDGVPYVRESVNPSYSESEYFGTETGACPVTVWSMSGDSSVDSEEIDNAVLEFDPAAQFAGYGGIPELTKKLARAGFVVDD